MELQSEIISHSFIDAYYENMRAGVSESFDEPGQFTLTIKLSEFYSYITSIWIFDSRFMLLVSPKEEQLHESSRGYRLAAGDIIVRVENNGQISDTSIKLDKDLIVTVGMENTSYKELKLPKLYSSAPIARPLVYASSDRKYVEASERISKERLSLDESFNINSGIFFFFRYPSPDLFKKHYCKNTYWHRFELLDERGNILLRFPDNCDVSDQEGYLGVCLALKKGNYYLQYKKRNHSRMVPIYVFENWYTQFFMTLADEPLFGSIRYFINAVSNFDSTDIKNSFVDICLDKLQNNDFTINPYLLRNISYGKFESPMLGLIGAFLYFSGKETKENRLFRVILENLQTRILRNEGDSPDIMALKILAMEHFGEPVKMDEIPNYSSTPMLRIAFDIIRRNSNRFPWLVRAGSIDDFIIEKQVYDSPFNTFKPLRAAILKRAVIEDEIFNDPFNLNEELFIEYAKYPAIKSFNRDLESPAEGQRLIEGNDKKAKREPEPMTSFAAFKKHGQAGAAIFEILSQNPKESTWEISKILDIPKVTVERIIRGLKL